MGKLKVKDIENRLLRRIFDKTGNQSLQAISLEAAMVAMLNDYEMRIQRQAGQLSVYQSIETNAKYPAPAGNGRFVPPVEQKQGELWLTGVNPQLLIPTIKLVREITGLGLKEAKDLVDKVRGYYQTWDHHNERSIPPAAPQKIPLASNYGGAGMPYLVERFAEIGAIVEIR